jgi:hypothetical protein
MAWALTRAGDEPARIAQKLHTTVEAVEDAVKSFEAARASVSTDIIDMVVNAEVLTAMNGVGDRLQRAMSAERFTGAYLAGIPVMEPDHTMAIEAIKTTGELVSQVRPKTGGAAINIGINNAGNGNGGGGTVKTFERRVREKRGVLADGDVKFLGDGQGEEVIEGDVIDDELEDEMMDGTTEAEIEEADEVRD